VRLNQAHSACVPTMIGAIDRDELNRGNRLSVGRRWKTRFQTESETHL